MPTLPGVHLLPSTGEFTYDTIPYVGAQPAVSTMTPINTYYAPGGTKTDYSYAIDQLQASHPECQTVSLVIAWFCDGLTAGSNNVYPSTTYASLAPTAPDTQPVPGYFDQNNANEAIPPRPAPPPAHPLYPASPKNWLCSGLIQSTPGIIPIPIGADGNFIYGGTPSDDSIVHCIRDLKSRGFRVVFYPFLLMTATGLPWRGLITYSPDISRAATSAVDAFLGSAAPSQFTPDFTNLTVGYSGSSTDWTYRRMILHYANLCVIAGGVNLFALGSELRGLESIRGPNWTKAGTTDAGGHATWDYPFVAGLAQLASDVRSVFDAAGLTRNLAGLQNLVVYSADWSVWMGYQHPGANGQWPHLDSLFASQNIDYVSLDNYLPLSDWTTGESGLDNLNWQVAPYTGAWPPPADAANGLGLAPPPTIYSKPYIKTSIEGGQYFDWFYNDGAVGAHGSGIGFDPNGSGLTVTLPGGDRLAQTRQPYFADQQILANKQLRWWWNNYHQAVYDNGDGNGFAPHGPTTAWVPNSKSILFLEYGVPGVDKGTNQPNVFYAPSSIESGTPFWSIWDEVPGGGYAPRRDDTIASLGIEAIYEYWNTDTPSNNESVNGVLMVQFAFSCVWCWDARPFPTFPLLSDVWGDAPQWPTGDWLQGKGPTLSPVAGSPDPSPGTHPTFPTLAALTWSVHIRPRFSTTVASHVSGRETRTPTRAAAPRDIELTYQVLRAASTYDELQTIAGFYATSGGADALFWLAPPGLSALTGQALGTGNGAQTSFPLCATTGAAVEAVQATSGVGAVYLDGVVQASGWSVSSGYSPAIIFASAPAPSVTVAADFGILWLCRFAEDVADLENFMALLWNFSSVKLQTVRL